MSTPEHKSRILELEYKLAETDKLLDAALNKLDALSPHGKCACSYDSKDDLCMHHSPKLSKAVAELADAKAKLAPNPACPCGHLMAMWVAGYSAMVPDESPDFKGLKVDGYCLSCREIEDAVRAYREVLKEVVDSHKIVQPCTHDNEGDEDICDGCAFTVEKQVLAALIWARVLLEKR